jgi:hypothetical protein
MIPALIIIIVLVGLIALGITAYYLFIADTGMDTGYTIIETPVWSVQTQFVPPTFNMMPRYGEDPPTESYFLGLTLPFVIDETRLQVGDEVYFKPIKHVGGGGGENKSPAFVVRDILVNTEAGKTTLVFDNYEDITTVNDASALVPIDDYLDAKLFKVKRRGRPSVICRGGYKIDKRAESPCVCRPGYSGALCDSCSVGYTGFPRCSRIYEKLGYTFTVDSGNMIEFVDDGNGHSTIGCDLIVDPEATFSTLTSGPVKIRAVGTEIDVSELTLMSIGGEGVCSVVFSEAPNDLAITDIIDGTYEIWAPSVV